MNRLTMKFGGTSLGDAGAITRAADICARARASSDQVLVVVSAMAEVTDMLLRGAHSALDGDQNIASIRGEISQKHEDVIEQLIREEERASNLHAELEALMDLFDQSCQTASKLGELPPALLDVIASIGERCSARLFAAVLQEGGLPGTFVEASNLIVTDDRFQNAAPDMQRTCEQVRASLVPLLEEGLVPVVTGFMASTPSGEITTLGRGGSDFSASILGACVDTDELWIWTDVDGVLTADPKIVPHARVIAQLSYSEVSELSYFGAKVLHPKTIQPIIDMGTSVLVKNTFRSDQEGTRIGAHPNGKNGNIKAVTAIQDLSIVTVEGRGMIGVPGVAARTFSAVADAGVSVLMISQASSEQSISFVVPKDTAAAVRAAVEQEMKQELDRQDISSVWSLDDIVIVTAVGAGLRDTPGIAAKIFGSLGEAEINVFAIAQGSSECSLSLVVASDDAGDAVRTIHDAVVVDA